MIHVVTLEESDRYAGALAAMHRHRARIFVDARLWRPHAPNLDSLLLIHAGHKH